MIGIDLLKIFCDRLTGDVAAKVRELNTPVGSLLASADTGCRCPANGCLLAAAAAANPDDNTPTT